MSVTTLVVLILLDVAVVALMVMDSPTTSLIAFGLSLIPAVVFVSIFVNGLREKKKTDGKEKIAA